MKIKIMKKGLNLLENDIYYKPYKIGEISIYCLFKPFKIKKDQIKLISVSPRLTGETEVLVFSFWNSKGEKFLFSNYDMDDDTVDFIRKYFKLKFQEFPAWDKFKWEDHENSMIDKIVFPQKLFWQDLFLKPPFWKKSILQYGKFFRIIPMVYGKLKPEIKEYLIMHTT